MPVSSTTQAVIPISAATRSAQACASSPGAQGESARNCCIDSYRAGVSSSRKQRRLQALAATMLDQTAHVQTRVLTLPPKR
jgi:hypothetical protein